MQDVQKMGFDQKTLDKANMIIMQLGALIKNFDADEIKEMISQYNLAESASIVFDAMTLQGVMNMYEQGREKFWSEVSFKKEFLEKLEPLVRFLNEQEAKVKAEMETCKS